jgi:hypothetical protein
VHLYIYASTHTNMPSTHTPLIDSYMTDYKSIVLSMSINPYLPVEMMEAIASCIEMPDKNELFVCVHEIHCEWCQEFGYSSCCRGYAKELKNKLAIEVFGGEKRIKSIEQAHWGLIQRHEEARDYGEEADD